MNIKERLRVRSMLHRIYATWHGCDVIIDGEHKLCDVCEDCIGMHMNELVTKVTLGDGLKRTPWFRACLCVPDREGWYEVESPKGWPGATHLYYFDKTWHAWIPKGHNDGMVMLGMYSTDKWRGLVEEFKNEEEAAYA